VLTRMHVVCGIALIMGTGTGWPTAVAASLAEEGRTVTFGTLKLSAQVKNRELPCIIPVLLPMWQPVRSRTPLSVSACVRLPLINTCVRSPPPLALAVCHAAHGNSSMCAT
jgi:hypothetical protein